MLASLLRRLIFIQAAAGAIVGFMLHRLAGTTPWSSLIGAVALPLFSSWVVCLVTGFRSKAAGSPLEPGCAHCGGSSGPAC